MVMMSNITVMALRIADIIQHGWIDNTSPGVTKGEFYVLGHAEPIKLFLRGNCWRDIAGTRMQFRNTNPILDEETFATLLHLQKGVVGDMTCSLKRKAPTIPMTELEDYFEQKKEIPYEWKNTLHLEWFSIANGRVVIESTDYEITLSEHSWTLSETQEQQQRIENSQAMNQFMQLAIDMAEAEAEISFESKKEADEYEWQQKHDAVMTKLGNSIVDNGPRGSLAAAMSYVFTSVKDAWPDKGLGIERGYRLAVMKRTLLACNNSLAYCNTLMLEDDSYESVRTEIHNLRDQILDTIKLVREEGQKKE